jgi:transcriptional antiterminator RfaH
LKSEQWYTLFTKPNAEYRVAAALEKQGLHTYLPEVESSKAHHGRVKRPFFPSYLFAKLDSEGLGLLQVQWTPGLRRVVAFDGRPVSLADEVIELIQRELSELKTRKRRPAHHFKPGETLRITAGPFRDLLAIFEGPTTPATRVRVLLDVLGQASRMHISVADIEKVTAQAEARSPKRPRRTRGRGRRINKKSAGLTQLG